MARMVLVKLLCSVYDVEALNAAAIAHAVEKDGMSLEEATAHMLDSDGVVDPGVCLRMILDPGSGPPGADIEDSSSEEGEDDEDDAIMGIFE